MRRQLICCVLVAACASRGSVPATPAPPLAAVRCDDSFAAPDGWREIVIDPGPAAFRIPPKYNTKRWVPPNMNMTMHGIGPNYLTFQEISGPGTLDSAAARREAGTPGYSGCRETVNGRPAVIHAFTSSRPIVMGREPVQIFEVKATIEIESGRYLHFAGVSISPALQREQLAIARSIRIIVP